MATYFSILAWKIPWTEKPGGLQSTGSRRVRHYWAAEHTCTYQLFITCIVAFLLYLKRDHCSQGDVGFLPCHLSGSLQLLSYNEFYDPFWVNFCEGCKFCTWILFPYFLHVDVQGPVLRRLIICSIVSPLLLYKSPVTCIYGSLFWDFLFCFI